MKKIYITGIAGLLGSNLAYLLKDKYEIYGCDRNKVLMSGVKVLMSGVKALPILVLLIYYVKMK